MAEYMLQDIHFLHIIASPKRDEPPKSVEARGRSGKGRKGRKGKSRGKHHKGKGKHRKGKGSRERNAG